MRKTKKAPDPKRQRIGRRSKGKGGAFEREICKVLSAWVSDNRHDDLFWRSAMSGGRATVSHRKGVANRQAGDITAVSPEGHVLTDNWYVECKFVKNLELGNFILYDIGTLARFWVTAKHDAQRHGRAAMIICKQNHGEPFVVIENNPRIIQGVPKWTCVKRNVRICLLSDLVSMGFET